MFVSTHLLIITQTLHIQDGSKGKMGRGGTLEGEKILLKSETGSWAKSQRTESKKHIAEDRRQRTKAMDKGIGGEGGRRGGAGVEERGKTGVASG
jgi:hypothetical protein